MGLFTPLALGPDDGTWSTCRVGGAGEAGHTQTHWLSKAPCRSDMHFPVPIPLSGERRVATPAVSGQRSAILSSVVCLEGGGDLEHRRTAPSPHGTLALVCILSAPVPQ